MAKGSRKAYYSVLGLAGLALLADRVLSGGGPKAANADTPLTQDLTVRPEDRAAPLPRANADTAASRLAGFGLSDAPAGDLAAVPDWLRPKAPAPAAAAAPAEKPWDQRHQISGFAAGARAGVRIDGRFLLVGDTLDGMTLSGVDTEKMVANFEGESGAISVPLPLRSSENGRSQAAAPR